MKNVIIEYANKGIIAQIKIGQCWFRSSNYIVSGRLQYFTDLGDVRYVPLGDIAAIRTIFD